MYWARYLAGSIHKAGMDGSNPITLVTGLIWPIGVTIDFASRRLYWAEDRNNRIQSSDLHGQDIRLVLQLPVDSWPWGIAAWNGRIYWGNYDNGKLQSANMDGGDMQTLYTESKPIHYIAVVPSWDQQTNRKNHCAGRYCANLCVLTPAS